ncbi:MAG: autotransporter domain-containing protein [Candidatus Omnitrophota bacterium]|nr:autotransporter domain-containing protein [Candidatus Omnitrophota bacterium]
MRENGMMYGLTGSYAYHNNLMLKAEGRGSIGRVDYKNSGTMDSIRDYSFEFRGLGGYDFPVLEKIVLTPYFGVGYRYLNDDSSGKISSTGAGGYERESNYIYSPVGIEGVVDIKNDWTIGARAEYDIFWWGRQISRLSDYNANYSDLRNTQRTGYGFRGSIKLQRNGEEFDLIIEPFVRYWNIAKSNDSNIVKSGTIVAYGYEPKNNSTEYGVKVGAKF